MVITTIPHLEALGEDACCDPSGVANGDLNRLEVGEGTHGGEGVAAP
jgi:hypothetical protein